MDTTGFLVTLALVLPLVGIGASVRYWRASKAPALAKVLVVAGIMALLVPGTCMGLVVGADAAGLLRYHP